MLLSLWNISNMFYPLDIELDITGDCIPRYVDAGGLYISDDRLVINYTDSTGVCFGSDGRITVHGLSDPEFFYFVRYIFNTYYTWENSVSDMIRSRQSLWKILSRSHVVINAPAVIFNPSLDIMAMNIPGFARRKNSAGLSTLNHRCSLTRLQKGKFLSDANYSIYKHTPWISPENDGLPRSLNANIIYNNRNYGILTFFEDSIPFNLGHFQLIEHFAKLIAPYFSDETSPEPHRSSANTVQMILDNKQVSAKAVTELYTDLGWRTSDRLCVSTFSCLEPVPPIYMRHLLSNIEQSFHNSISFVYKDMVISVSDDSVSDIPACSRVKQLISRNTLDSFVIACTSTDFTGIINLPSYLKQCLLLTGRCSHKVRTQSFFDNALDLILDGYFDPSEWASWVHPDVRALFEYDASHNSTFCKTFRAFLLYERNITAAARALYIHRNTMIYRMQKIFQIVTADFNNPYDREYAVASLRLVQHLKQS